MIKNILILLFLNFLIYLGLSFILYDITWALNLGVLETQARAGILVAFIFINTILITYISKVTESQKNESRN